MKSTLLIISSLNKISPANYLIDSFELVGWNVVALSDVQSEKATYIYHGSVDLDHLIRLKNVNPDLILFVEGGEMAIFPVNFSEIDCPKFWWGIDTHNDYNKHLNISRLFDHSFIAQKKFVEDLKRDGVHSVSWLPLAYATTHSSDYSGPREIDVAYVGSTNWKIYPQRGELLDSILEVHKNSFIGQCVPSEMFRKYEHSKIVFNFSPMNDINMRFFEAMGSGALLMTNRIYNNGADDLFHEGKDYLIYNDTQDLLLKINTVLNDQESLLAISQNGQERVRSSHTYSHRVTEIIEHISAVEKKQTKSHMTTSSILLSMGLLSDSMYFYFLAVVENETGVKNNIIKFILSPLFRITLFSAKCFEFVAGKLKRFR
jgi:hypothetical protein